MGSGHHTFFHLLRVEITSSPVSPFPVKSAETSSIKDLGLHRCTLSCNSQRYLQNVVVGNPLNDFMGKFGNVFFVLSYFRSAICSM